jgi:hypothetical protein
MSGKLFLIASVFLILFSFRSNAQIVKSMPYSSEEYFTVLEQHFERIPNTKKKEAKNFLDDLEDKWFAGYFNDAQKESIYEVSNLMVQKKMSAIPYFTSLFTTLISGKEKSIDNSSLQNWLKSVTFVLNQIERNTSFLDYLKNSKNLFEEQFIFSNRIIQWKVDPNWQIVTDSTIKLVFEKTDLICYTKRDSSNIYETSGVYYPLERKWIGNGGIIDWQRADLNPKQVYANLSHYEIELKMSKFEADSVELNDFRYFDQPLYGKLTEEVLASRRGEKALYPSFISYTKEWKIPEIFNGIDFSGGFKVEGSRLIGIGDASKPVSIVFKKEGKDFIRLKSNSFSIYSDKIRSQNTSVAIYYEEDSIYHNGLRMNYSDTKRELSLIRDQNGLRAAPFFNTFHQLDMLVEAVYWNVDEDIIDFDMIKGMNKRPALFTSANRYSQYHFEKIRGLDTQHPLSNLKYYAKENHSNVIHILDYAKYVKLPYEQVKLQLLKLSQEGFLFYDSDNDIVILKDRAQFYLDARSGKVDYDVIFFKSDSTKLINAELEIDSFDLKINGVQRIILSDSQNLIIEPGRRDVPNDEYIIVGKNRNFNFNGIITAGRFSFNASGCNFNYDAFKLFMPQIDSMWFWVDGDPLPMGGRERVRVKTSLVDLAGGILIDHPSNKSGLRSFPIFPFFNSEKDSYAFYDKNFIEKGVYTRDRFYYTVSPFVLRSLDKIKTEDIKFEGFLHSGDIFPDIVEPLIVMDDYSLGFQRNTPAEGYPIYSGKGKYFNQITLNNSGLRGAGRLNYLTSITDAKDFVFYPDSMNVYAQSFTIRPTALGTEFPFVRGEEVYQHWLPYQDNMSIKSLEYPIKMYDTISQLRGVLNLKPTGLKGRGKLKFKVAEMTSNNFDFNTMTFVADTTNFDDDGWSLTNFKANADYNERKIVFLSNDGTSLVEFPDNQYICYMDEATWFMDKEETVFTKEDATTEQELEGLSNKDIVDIEIDGSEFISVRPGQDSLSFKSLHASFNSKNKIISARGVFKIHVADAAIFPKNGIVRVFKNAEMEPFKEAEILANTTTKYHEIQNADVKILGGKNYMAKGEYKYVDLDRNEQNIYFDNIRVDTTFQTIASGTILKESDFTISPAFGFYGDVHLFASRKPMEFDGGFKANTQCTSKENWIAFNSIIDPNNVLIPIPEQPRVPDISNQRKYLGKAHSFSKREVYNLFYEDKLEYVDSILISASGFMKYNYAKSTYEISTKEKLLQKNRPDNYIEFNSLNCDMSAEGMMNFDIFTGDVNLKSYGFAHADNRDSDFTVAAGIDFYFSEKALKEMVEAFKNIDLDAYNLGKRFYSKATGGFMGLKESDQYISRLALGQQRKIPEKLLYTIFINEMEMKYERTTRSYISKGKIALGGLGEDRINAYVDGYVEFRKNRQLDEINIYFEIGGQWFYFNYQNSVLGALSSLGSFNQIIRDEVSGKGDKNYLKTDEKDAKKSNYRYNTATVQKKAAFLSRAKSIQ